MDRMLRATARAENDHFWFRALRRNADRVLGDAVGGARMDWIVDCGAGTGRNLDWLEARGHALGVELTPAGLEVGRAHGRRLVRGTVRALPLGDSSVAAATSFDVLYCLDDDTERQAVAEMWRVLRPGGVIVIQAAALDVLHGSHSALTHEVRRYTRSRLTSLLVSAGFSIERMTYTNMVTFPIALAVRTLDRLTGRAGVASEADLRVPPGPINRALDGLMILEGWCLRWIDLPVGTSLLCVARKPAGPEPRRP